MITIRGPGGYDRLEYRQLQDGELTEGANIRLNKIPDSKLVTIKTFACGVNYADICIRWGLYSSAKEYVGWPITPGFEFSGEVTAVGSSVTQFTVGQKVFGVSLFGAYSSSIRVPEWQVFALPEKMTVYEAAGFMAVGLTAWYAMFELARPRPGSAVLVHSAAGGVGSMLVQMAKIAKCKVVGVVGSNHKIQAVRQLGCDIVIDKSSTDIWSAAERASPQGYHVIFDANGIATLSESYRHLCPTGRLIVYGFHTMLPKSTEDSQGSIGWCQWLSVIWNYLWTPRFNPMKLTNENKSVMGFNLSFMFEHKHILEEAMAQMLAWIANDQLRVMKVTTFLLSKAADAHRALESGNTVGKLVLLTQEESQKSERHVKKD